MFEVLKKYVGLVLLLSTEHLTKKVPFGIFQEKSVDYMVTTLTNSGDMRVTIKKTEDTMNLFGNNNKPK